MDSFLCFSLYCLNIFSLISLVRKKSICYKLGNSTSKNSKESKYIFDNIKKKSAKNLYIKIQANCRYSGLNKHFPSKYLKNYTFFKSFFADCFTWVAGHISLTWQLMWRVNSFCKKIVICKHYYSVKREYFDAEEFLCAVHSSHNNFKGLEKLDIQRQKVRI